MKCVSRYVVVICWCCWLLCRIWWQCVLFSGLLSRQVCLVMKCVLWLCYQVEICFVFGQLRFLLLLRVMLLLLGLLLGLGLQLGKVFSFRLSSVRLVLVIRLKVLLVICVRFLLCICWISQGIVIGLLNRLVVWMLICCVFVVCISW